MRFGADTILEDLSFCLEDADRIGMIGVNGAGKTTFLNTLVGQKTPDAGELFVKKNIRIGYLKQNSGLDSANTILEELRHVFDDVLACEARMREIEASLAQSPDAALTREYDRLQTMFEARDGYQLDVKIRRVLFGMGFAERDIDTPVGVLSGGEKTRLAIAKLLLEEPELLILDEPTNHLDFVTLKWLEDYLAGYRGAVLIVSHDRYFLDRTISKVWEIEDRHLHTYRGNYSSYKQQKAERIKTQLREYEKQARSIEKMEDYAQRNMARASTSKSAKSRLALLSHIERIEKPKTRVKTPHFVFPVQHKSGNDVLVCEHLNVCVGKEKQCIVQDVSFEMKRAQRLAVIGKNGTGKSSLIKTLAGIFPLVSGNFVWGKGVSIGYYDQENKDLCARKSILQEVWDRFPAELEYDIRGLLGQVLLTGEDVFKEISVLSGGERAKVGFAILMHAGYNVLLLDEPTNHLDLAARESLEEALQSFEGTLIFVSHDRYFINTLAQRILEIDNSKAVLYEGGFDSYTAQKETAVQTSCTPPEEKKPNNKKRARAQMAQKRDALARIEKQITQLESDEQELLAAMRTYSDDYEKLQALTLQLEQNKSEHEAAMEQWTELMEWLEAEQ